ncbi:MAG: ATP-binding protein [Chloroflexota bacterium]|nr:ATP-binding protein [Chloroflexota bacterium]
MITHQPPESGIRRLLESRYRISTQLYLAIGSAVALTIAASLVGWISFNSVGEAQSTVNEDSLPEVVAAFGVAQNSGTLVNAAPLLTASTSPEELAAVSAAIDDARISLDQHLTVLLGADMSSDTTIISLQRLPDIPGLTDLLNLDDVQISDDEGGTSEHIRSQVDTLTIGIGAIESGMTEIFEINEQKDALRSELAIMREQIDDVMVPAVDNQLFYTMTGYRNLGDAPAERVEHFSEAELARYRSLAGLHADATTASQILESSFSVSSAPHIEPLRERFESAAGSMDRNLAALEGWPYRPQILPLMSRLVELGTGADSGFDLLERQLVIKQQQQDLLALNRAIASTLVQEVDALVESARTSADEATLTSAQAILTGRTLLLAISAVSIVGALIAWLFVGRILLRRLWRLHDRMLEMAGGDLETEVELDGRDEVADMARALEVFRRNSLEAQRLNLVEELADELLNKNEELETVLADLERAQDQIVVREKLAALGELTAGVAHEIRNPLNFIKNFSEASEELLDELGELMTDVADDLDEEDKDYLDEITGDLTGNMERIRTHGDRANRIVNDMLMMGRDTGEQRMTDINSLLDEHARLAYHSARALDTEFQLGIERDLDPNMGEVNVVPRDLGRVFLNMVGNACDATDEKRRTIDSEIAAEGRPADSEPYMPTLWIATHRSDHNIQIRIRDNGGGMPPDIIDKIFNPFFTTKPTDKGTGLGLAISNDIVRQHGGTITVESQPDEYTEMLIEIPLETPAIEAEAIEAEAVSC